MNCHIGYYMKKISNRMEAGHNRSLKNYQLTGTQLAIMEYLFHNDNSLTVSDIAAYFDVKHTSVLHVIKLLEKKEYIYRAKAKHSGQARPITLTKQGKQLVRQNEYRIQEVDKVLFANFTEEEYSTLLHLLQKLEENTKLIEQKGE